MFVTYCLITLIIFPSCSPTYPKGKIVDSVKHIMKKEHKLDSNVYKVGKTIYLELLLPELIKPKNEIPKSELKKINAAVLTLSRVCLSTDEDIEFLVVTASTPKWKFDFRIIQRVEDIKSFLYRRISKTDYEERLIMETELQTHMSNERSAEYIPGSFKEITLNEFVARLVVSQVNKMIQFNPFLNTALNNIRLQWHNVENGYITVKLTNSLENILLLEEIIKEEVKKISLKYNIVNLNEIVLIDPNNKKFSIPVNTIK